MHKSNKEKKSESMKKVESREFDDSVSHDFTGIVKLGPNVEVSVDFKTKPASKNDGHLTFDAVEDEMYSVLEKYYPEEYYPQSEVVRIYINEKGKQYRVVAESDKKTIAKLRRNKETILVLPNAVYKLTPPFALYSLLMEYGIINGDSPDYDRDTYEEVSRKFQEYLKS